MSNQELSQQGCSFQLTKPRECNEKPQHQVTLNAFHIGKYPITQEQYQVVMGNNPS